MVLTDKVNPYKLFLIDSLGGLVTALMLGLVLARFESSFGIPQKILYFLSMVGCIYFIYSFICFLSKMKNWRPFMKIIAIANLLYCFLTVGLVIFLWQSITIVGIIYFVLEILIIITLVIIELKTASK